jgi:hypothetical protein
VAPFGYQTSSWGHWPERSPPAGFLVPVITMSCMGYRFEYQSSWEANLPASNQGSGTPIIVANIFKFAVDGFIVGLRYCRQANDDNEHVGVIFREADNGLLGVTMFPYNSGATPDNWQHAYMRRRVQVTAGTLYYIGVSFGSRKWRYTNAALTGVDIVTGDITVPMDGSVHWNGAIGLCFARGGWTHAAGIRYGVDCLFLRGDLI